MHIGNKIKEEVSKKNISVTDFAKLINKSRPYTYSIFEKENIDTELLIHISSVLNLSPASFFEDITHSVMQNGTKNILVGRDNNGNISTNECQDKLEDALLEIKHLKAVIEGKDRLLEEKERLINVLMNK
ncbi:helix-turn-helix domain-containing protein [Bacteroides thetaiotaomicron]|uniref:helix-turn-helix domain-containing protein n=1 Tax=Bacteroides thetaiotaomicron TaxID=818 RepID=UPI002174EFEE|nr:helix-turn-helix transcriptional regulator [Bacteroides thetaiotaomicron]